MEWYERVIDVEGTVVFPGSLPPRPGALASLKRQGIGVQPIEGRPGARWSVRLTHPTWGEADVVLPHAGWPTPNAMIEFDPRLSAHEKQVVRAAGCGLRVTYRAARNNLLRDRKFALRFMHLVLGSDGVAAFDHLAQRFWTPAALNQELSHGADLDIEALITIHKITKNDRAYWLHSHGLAAAGFFDFSILDPGDLDRASRFDVVRALAFAIVEQRLVMGGGSFRLLGEPALEVRAVRVREFAQLADKRLHPDWHQDLSDDTSGDHTDQHAVICEGGQPSRLARWFRRDRPRASPRLSADLPDGLLIMFSQGATSLMAARARETYPVLRALVEELREIGAKALVKLGYVVDGGGPDQREHLWFEVAGFADDCVDATLINEPFWIARMKAGNRADHPIALLSDWIVFTPAGAITPRDFSSALECRERRVELIAAANAASPPT
jgi:hypothetical protein